MQRPQTYTRGSASAAASSAPVLQQDAKQVAELPGRSPMRPKSRGDAQPAASASAPPMAASVTASAAAVVTAQTPAPADEAAGMHTHGVSVATQATDHDEESIEAAPTPVPRSSTQRAEAAPAASGSTNSIRASHRSESTFTSARGRTPMQRPKPSRRPHASSRSRGRDRQPIAQQSSDSDSDGSTDDGVLQGDSRHYSGHGQGRRSSVPQRASKPKKSALLKPIQARIDVSRHAIHEARRAGPPVEQYRSFYARNPVVPGSPTDSTQSEDDDDDDHAANDDDERMGNRFHNDRTGFIHESKDEEAEFGSEGGLCSESISPIERQGSGSDEDDNSRKLSPSFDGELEARHSQL
jgi:hypothetical protein